MELFSRRATQTSVLQCIWRENCILVTSRLGKSSQSLRANALMKEGLDLETDLEADPDHLGDPQGGTGTVIIGDPIAESN